MSGPRAERGSDSSRGRRRPKGPADESHTATGASTPKGSDTATGSDPTTGSDSVKDADTATGTDPQAETPPGLGPLTGWLETIAYIPEKPEEPDEPESPGPAPTPNKGVPSHDLADNRPSNPDRVGDARARTRRLAVVRLPAYRERLGELAAHDRDWRARAHHAKRMGPRLEKHLAPEWRVLHSVPIGGEASTVDHLLIGPGGVFTLSTHEHRDARVWVSRDDIRINGEPVDYLRPAIVQAGRIAKVLTWASGRRVRVMPCLVMVTGSAHPDIVVHEPIEGVLVLDSSTVVRAFRNLNPVLTPDDVEALFDAARRRESWVPGGV